MRYRILDQHGLNFLTLTVVEWIDLFTRKAFAEIVIESLRWCQQNKGLEIYGFVLMPSHLHLIARAGSEYELSAILQSFKSFTASKIIDQLKDTTLLASGTLPFAPISPNFPQIKKSPPWMTIARTWMAFTSPWRKNNTSWIAIARTWMTCASAWMTCASSWMENNTAWKRLELPRSHFAAKGLLATLLSRD